MRPKEDIKKRIKNAGIVIDIKADRKIFGNILQAFDRSEACKLALSQTNIREIIMKNRMTKLVAMTVMIIAVVVGINEFVGSGSGAVAWGEVLENIRSSKTVTFTVRPAEDGPPDAKVMVIDPHLLRIELLSEEQLSLNDGDVLIIDADKEKCLILDTANKRATVVDTPAEEDMLGMYDRLRDLRYREDSDVEQIGYRPVGDKQAVGFKLKKDDENREMTIWADPETKLPVLIEETLAGAGRQVVVTDIVFDADLDESLFSVEPPDGYVSKEVDYGPQIAAAKRTRSIANVARIQMACKEYVADHNGQWPEALQELAKYGVDAPLLEGYTYLKPPASPSESRIVLYEAYDSWNNGITVGFADGHVEFIEDESDFNNRLGKN